MIYVISVKKLDDCPPLRLLNLPTFQSECLNQMHKEEKSFVKEKKERKTSSKSSRKSDKKNQQKNSANSSSAIAKSPSEYMREYRAWKKNN
ncbi:UNVERIFIED_CONTAM: hypothetical protein NCL1_20842 [Trichonephila clavipes]